MRILVISSFYPPKFIGGYEIMCKEAVDELRKRGHSLYVLTSKYGNHLSGDDSSVYRLLDTTFQQGHKGLKRLIRFIKRELTNKRIVRRFIRTLKPDIIYIWHISHVSISLAYAAQASGLPVAYYVLDHWMSNWDSDPFREFWTYPSRSRSMSFGKRVMRRFFESMGLLPSEKLDLRNAQYASQYLYQLPFHNPANGKAGQVIHWGIKADNFPFKESNKPPRKMLYVGQIIEHKGLATAINAVKTIMDDPERSVTFSIVGDYEVHEYGRNIYRYIESSPYRDRICFKGVIPYEKIRDIYQEHDILIFPSLWDEPFGNTLLEAMSSGLAIVATGTGGSREILEHGRNSLIFPPGDSAACAAHLLYLMDNPESYERIRHEGRRTVEEKFNFEEAIDAIEQCLLRSIKHI